MAFMTDTPEEKPIAVPAYSSSGIFGEDVNDVRQQIAMQQQNNAMQFANMPRGRGPVYAAALAGQQLGGALESAAGYQDPRVRRRNSLKKRLRKLILRGFLFLKTLMHIMLQLIILYRKEDYMKKLQKYMTLWYSRILLKRKPKQS